MTGRRILAFCFVLCCGFLAPSVHAEEGSPSRVGRVAAVDGAVAVRPAGSDWGDSGANMPIAAGMSVRTAAQSRAMLRIGAEAVALAPATELEIRELDDSGTQLVLRQGRIGVHLSPLDPAHSIEIDISRGGVWLLTPGDYDLAAGDDHIPGRLAVFDGRARFVGNGTDTAVATGATASLGGADSAPVDPDTAAADDFVAWWRAASADRADPELLQHVTAEMTGYDALDDAGRWQTITGTGAVWFPKVAANWAPYRDGRWRWVPPWGWTWIDDAPWGFAPSHYGRWAKFAGETGNAEERWGWVPGTVVEHPVYMPAAVAFLGTAGVGLSCPDAIGPAVAWFPLAPGEVYWPAYTADLGAIRRLNAGAVADVATIAPGAEGQPSADIVNGAYRNRRFATVVPRTVFLSGRAVADALVQLPERRLENAPLLAGSPQLAPMPPRSAAVAMAAPLAPRVASAIRTLARILKPRSHPAPAIRAAVLVRSAPAGHIRVPSLRLARAHVVAASARSAHRPVRVAVARRRS